MRIALPLLLPLVVTSFTQELASSPQVLRKEPTDHVHSSRRKAQVAIDAAAQLFIEAEPGRLWNSSGRQQLGSLSQLHRRAKDISGETLYLTLMLVILTGIALGILIPLAVNYYYEEIASPPWLRDLMEEVGAAPRSRSGTGTGEGAGANRGRSVEEEIYARSPYESPRARRPRSSSSQRRRRQRARETRGSLQEGERTSGEADVSEDVDKVRISMDRLPKIPQEHPAFKQISSDEAGDSPSASTAARLRLLKNEWLQATAVPRGVTEKRVSEESTTAAEDSASSSSLHRTGLVRESTRRGRSPDEPQTPKSSSSKRTVSFDNKVEVKNLESDQPMKKRSGSGSSQRSPKKEDKRRAQVRSRSPKA